LENTSTRQDLRVECIYNLIQVPRLFSAELACGPVSRAAQARRYPFPAALVFGLLSFTFNTYPISPTPRMGPTRSLSFASAMGRLLKTALGWINLHVVAYIGRSLSASKGVVVTENRTEHSTSRGAAAHSCTIARCCIGSSALDRQHLTVCTKDELWLVKKRQYSRRNSFKVLTKWQIFTDQRW
jgi:hypothetical protein